MSCPAASRNSRLCQSIECDTAVRSIHLDTDADSLTGQSVFDPTAHSLNPAELKSTTTTEIWNYFTYFIIFSHDIDSRRLPWADFSSEILCAFNRWSITYSISQPILLTIKSPLNRLESIRWIWNFHFYPDLLSEMHLTMASLCRIEFYWNVSSRDSAVLSSSLGFFFSLVCFGVLVVVADEAFEIIDTTQVLYACFVFVCVLNAFVLFLTSVRVVDYTSWLCTDSLAFMQQAKFVES